MAILALGLLTEFASFFAGLLYTQAQAGGVNVNAAMAGWSLAVATGITLGVWLAAAFGALAVNTVLAPFRLLSEAELRVEQLSRALADATAPAPVPKLQVRGPYRRTAEVDTNQAPLWSVIVENTVPGTVATNVRVRMDHPDPEMVMSFPVELHRMHDNDLPFTKRHSVRHDEPLTFDVLACGQQAPAMFYLYRADGDENSQRGPEWMLSSSDNEVISAAISEPEGWRFEVIATPDPPASPARLPLRLRADEAGGWPIVERTE